MSSRWESILDQIRRMTGRKLKNASVLPAGGGCINETVIIETSDNEPGFFIKRNASEKLPMFEAEAEGLAAILETGTIRAPRPVCFGIAGESAFFALEAIEMRSRADAASQEKMGRQLAALHRVTSDTGAFGWHRDNTIGELPQRNPWTASWAEFFGKHRLGFQFDLAARKGRPISRAAAFLDRLPALLGDHEPAASLLHGDLWGGNASFDSEGEPVIYDPATYFGDRETDLAFSEMFGGFGAAFYSGYCEAWPLERGYELRKQIYNLYHLVNHANHFGGGYADQSETIIGRLLAG
jgi:fructosamine-3-kinase